MRTLTTDTQTQATQKLGTEPIVIIKVEWTTGTKYYSDKTFILGSLDIKGKIYDFSPVRGELNAKSFGQLQSASVTLSDIDSTLKNIFDNTVIEQRLVTVYNHYEGLTEADLTIIMMGKVVSPITWSEGTRRLAFEINSEIDSDDLLLEIKELSTTFPANEDMGKVLPLCFGTPLRVPGLLLQSGCTGELLTEITSWTTWYSYHDGSYSSDTAKVSYKSTEFHVSNFENYAGQTVTLEIENSLYLGTFDTVDKTKFVCAGLGGFNNGYPNSTSIVARMESDPDSTVSTCLWLSNTLDVTGKVLLMHKNVTYYYLKDPTGKITPVEPEAYNKIKNAVTGTDITAQQKTKEIVFVARVTSQVGNKVMLSAECVDDFGNPVYFDASTNLISIKGKTEYEWSVLPTDNEPFAWTIAPGARVKVYGKDSLFIVNSVPSTAIHEVVARRKDKVTAVPSSYYTVYLDYVAIVNGETEHLTVIKMDKPLTSYAGQEWNGDDIHVSLTSSIGPNTVTDVIDWIITNRTRGLTKDATSFTETGSAITNYPSHFAVLSQGDSIDLMKDFAWQARVGLYIDSGIVTAKYLSKEPTATVYTANIGVIQFRSMAVEKTSTDEIYPKFTGLWHRSYIDDELIDPVRKSIFEHNTLLYTKRDMETIFSIYNIESCVTKSARFWSSRMSNSWVRVHINTFLTSLNVQIWDAVEVVCPYINNGTSIIGIVEGISFDTATRQINLNVWLPLKQGEGDIYLVDTSDTMPPSPALGLDEIDYTIYTDITRKFGQQTFLLDGPAVQENSRESTKPLKALKEHKGDKLVGKITSVGDNYLEITYLCPDTDQVDGYIIDAQGNRILPKKLYISKATNGFGSQSLRPCDWVGKSFPGEGDNGETVTYTKVDNKTRIKTVAGVNVTETIYPPYESPDPTFKVKVEADFFPEGTGLAYPDGSNNTKIVWKEKSHRVWKAPSTGGGVSSYPAKVKSKSGLYHLCDIYGSGIDGAVTSADQKVFVLQLNLAETLPAGTWIIVSMSQIGLTGGGNVP